MKTKDLFTQLLNIGLPFSVSSVAYKEEELKKSVHIYLSVETSRIYRPTDSTIHAYEERTWRHLKSLLYSL